MSRFGDFFHTGQDGRPGRGRFLRLPWFHFTAEGGKNGVGRGCPQDWGRITIFPENGPTGSSIGGPMGESPLSDRWAGTGKRCGVRGDSIPQCPANVSNGRVQAKWITSVR